MSSSLTTCCGGCAGVAPATPVVVDNRPGQPAIVARVGTYGSFLSSMVAGLSDTNRPALAAFTTRSSDDFTISLLDAFACVADVLTFYQERYAQENYLRTATEQRSVLELARLIGYELAPGVAAHTPLAFTMDTTAGSPISLDLPVGTQAQSIPGPGQTAQTFETVEEITARPEWSAMQPRQTRLLVPHTGSSDIWLVGGSLNVKPGDTVGVIGTDKQAHPTTSEQWDFRRIIKVTADVKAGGKDPVTGAPTGVTHLVLDRALGPDSPYTEDAPPLVVLFRRQGSLFGYNAPLWGALPSQQTQTSAPVGIYAGDKNKWAEQYLPSTAGSIDLDTVYSQAVPGGWVVLTEASSSASAHTAELFKINGAAETNLAEFALTGRATRLFIAGMNIDWFSPRRASVFLQSGAQTLAERPIDGPLERTRLTLANYVDGLQSGRTLIVAGQIARFTAAVAGQVLTAPDGSTRTLKLGDQFFLLGHAAGVYTLQAIDGWTGTIATAAASFTQAPALTADPVLAEIVTIGSVDQSDLLHTAIVPVTPLVNFYDRSTVTIYGNVAQATVGQTVQEVMGSGNAATPFQSFQLRQPPVTWTLAAAPTGVQSSVQVFANDVPWTEAVALYGQGAHAQVFAERRDELGNTTVLLGDGALYGARPPSGTMNLRAQYRRGLGVAGNVDAGQISLLLSRPLGLKAVINPLPATDGADPEPLQGARASAPRSVATLDRAVSLLDYQSYAQGFAGIAKALATSAWDGMRRRLVLTLAGQAGAPVPPDGDVAGKLAASLANFGEVAVPLLLQSYSPVTFRIGLLVRPTVSGNNAAAQQAAVAALRAAYTFDARGFGQAVALSEVAEIAQGAAGVAAVQVTMLYRSDQPAGLSPRLGAAGGTTGAESAVPAEVLTLDPGPFAALGAMA